MSNQLDALRAEIEAAKAALVPAANARTTRGNAIKAATKSRRDSTWRSAVYSVRCKPEIAEGLRKLAKSKSINLAEWFEGVAEELIERGSK